MAMNINSHPDLTEYSELYQLLFELASKATGPAGRKNHCASAGTAARFDRQPPLDQGPEGALLKRPSQASTTPDEPYHKCCEGAVKLPTCAMLCMQPSTSRFCAPCCPNTGQPCGLGAADQPHMQETYTGRPCAATLAVTRAAKPAHLQEGAAVGHHSIPIHILALTTHLHMRSPGLQHERWHCPVDTC